MVKNTFCYENTCFLFDLQVTTMVNLSIRLEIDWCGLNLVEYLWSYLQPSFSTSNHVERKHISFHNHEKWLFDEPAKWFRGHGVKTRFGEVFPIDTPARHLLNASFDDYSGCWLCQSQSNRFQMTFGTALAGNFFTDTMAFKFDQRLQLALRGKVLHSPITRQSAI